MPPRPPSPGAAICDARVAQQLAAFASQTRDAIFVGGSDDRVEWVNDAACALCGCERSELLGRRIAIFPDDEEAERAAVDHMRSRFAAGEPAQLEASIRARDGRVRWIELRMTPLHGGSEAAPGWVAVAVDVSDRKRAAAALAESEERYRGLVEESPQPVAVHAEGRLVYLNRAALSLIGAAAPQAVLGRPIFEFLHPDYHGIAAERILKMEHVGDPAEPIVETLLRVDGAPVDVKLAATPVVWSGRPAIQLTGDMLGADAPRRTSGRLPVVDFSALLLDVAPRIEQRIAPRAALTLDLCEARVALRGSPARLEELVCLLAAQACAALPGGRGALVLKSERQDLCAEALAAFVPGSGAPGRYLVFEASAPEGELDGAARGRLFEADFAERQPGRGPGLANALALARAQGAALRVQSGGARGLRIALALPLAAGPRRVRSGARALHRLR